jgi:hypothetical protein
MQAFHLARQLGDPYLACQMLSNMAILHTRLRETDEAKSYLSELLEYALDHILRPLQCEVLVVYARLLFNERRAERAAEVCGLLSVNMHAAAVEPRLTSLVESLSKVLTFDSFTASHERGRLMSLDGVLDQTRLDLRKVRAFITD